jgi:uncharacterized protein DUF4926
MADLELLSVVALLEDLPAQGLLRGQVGTVVEILAPSTSERVFEVEFSDDRGQTYASVPIPADQLIRLRHEPSHQAA